MVSVPLFAVFNAPVDDLCTWLGSGWPLLDKAEQ